MIAVAAVVALEILSILGINIPQPYAPIVFGAFVLIVGCEVLRDGVKALFRLNFGSINLLMLIAVTAAFYLGEYPEAAAVIVLYVLGEKLEDIGIDNSKSALNELISKSPKSALVKNTGENTPVEQIPVGTLIQIKPGDSIPLDGVIQCGETAVDESTITGEPIPKEKFAGDTVFAGTLNKSGYIEVLTSKTAADTTLSKIVEMTFEARANKSESQKFIQRFARIYTPGIIALAALLFVVPVCFMNGDVDTWLKQAVTLLVISCPCALVISTPVAIYAAIGNASAKGALVKGGKYLEALASVKAICLDKTRTITHGNPTVSDVVPINNTAREELLACTAGTEVFSEHPLAQAIIDAAHREGFEPHAAEKFESVAGKGAKAKCIVCNNDTVHAGNLDYIREHLNVSDETEDIVKRLSAQGKTSVVVGCGNTVSGVIGLTDEIKPDSAAALREMKHLQIEPIMLTGDNRYSAAYVAKEVGIDEVYGDLLPDGKVARIKAVLEKYGTAAMVGDGVNDAPALAQSTVGIAMGAAGSDSAIEVADIALMNDKLSLIPYLVRLARTTVNTIKINTVGAIAVKLIFILLAFLGHGNLVMAITADVGVTLVVILISLRLLTWKPKTS